MQEHSVNFHYYVSSIALAWLSGVFFGIGLWKKLLERKDGGNEACKGDRSAPNPLPIGIVESDNSPGCDGRPVPALSSADNKKC